MSAPRASFLAPPLRILVVDDEAANRELLELILSLDGFSVETAASGAEALASVARSLPDLVLLDLMMPEMTGYEVMSQLKSSGTTDHIPIIVVTALSDRTSRIRALAAGAADVLTKPTERSKLCARVRSALHGARPPQPPGLRIMPGMSIAAEVALVAVQPNVYSEVRGESTDAGGSVAKPIDVHVRAAEELLRAYTVGNNGPARETAVAAAQVYVALFKELAPMLGESGVRALFARSLKLTSARFACFQPPVVTAEPRPGNAHLETQLVDCLSQQEPAAAIAIATTLYAIFLGLLAGFIGDGLAGQFLNQVFAARKELASKEVSQ